MQKLHLALGIVAAWMLFMVGSIPGARAQANGAALTGTVTDQTHAVVPKATVSITDEASGIVRIAASSTSAGAIDNKTGHREVQFAAKYLF